jgi:hypothetical protein
MLCNSCKNKSSTERCSSKALKNLQFCGKHARSKKPKLWTDTADLKLKALLIQKIWKGWNVRRILKLSGPGVLKRSVCHNDDELYTCEEKDRIHPGNYFAFEESGKVYWFDIRTIHQWCTENLKPTNPYTKEPITKESLQRLRECSLRRTTVLLPLYHNPLYSTNLEKALTCRWNTICQILTESLYEEIVPSDFFMLNRHRLWEFTFHLRASVLSWAKQHTGANSRRDGYYSMIMACWRRQTLEYNTESNILYYIGGTLLKILNDCKEPHEFCFQILSARHRL